MLSVILSLVRSLRLLLAIPDPLTKYRRVAEYIGQAGLSPMAGDSLSYTSPGRIWYSHTTFLVAGRSLQVIDDRHFR